MPVKFSNTAPEKSLFVVRKGDQNMYYGKGFKNKKLAKKKRNELNAAFIEGEKKNGKELDKGPWITEKGDMHWKNGGPIPS